MVNASKLKNGSLIWTPQIGIRLVADVKPVRNSAVEKAILSVLFKDHTPVRCDDKQWQDSLILHTISDMRD
jgi:hypothetical protein